MSALRSPLPRLSTTTWVDVATLLTLATIAMVGLGSAFDSIDYLLAGLGGLVVGTLAALAAQRFRLGTLPTIAVAIGAYFVLGSVFALPRDALFGFLPTPDTLASLTIGAVFGWADILTLRAPVSLPDYVTAVPYLAGWLVAVVSITLATRWLPNRTRTPWRSGLLLIGPTLLYTAGVLLGTDEAYFAAVRGVTFACIALIWLGWRRRDSAQVAIAGGRQMLRRKVVGTAAVVVSAAVVGTLVGNLVVPPEEDRFVLRENIDPPFEQLVYPSPLAGFREYTKDYVDTTLMTVTGLQTGERIRLATMDTYDGVSWGVAGAAESSDSSGQFRLVGRTIPEPPLVTSNTESSLDVTIAGYDDVWIPSTGYAEAITLSQAQGAADEDVRYNEATGTAVLTSGLASGDSYSIGALQQDLPAAEALADVPVAAIAPSAVSRIPDPVIAKAAEIANTASTPYAKLQALEQWMITTGYLSHGTASDQAPSRAGHGADRMFDMVTLPTMVGDEEQYASLFALMARSLNYPVRVVMGFAPEAVGGGQVSVTGDDVTAWIEVAFDGVGWLPFFPTPDETDVPQDQVPKPKTEPQPQVRQPPRTDSEPDDLVTAVEIDDSDDEEKTPFVLPTWVYIAGIVLAIPIVLLLIPLLVIGALKKRRLRRRRNAGAGDLAAAGAWDEALDQYSELGFDVPQRTTRRHVAAGLQDQVLDRGVTETTGLTVLAAHTDDAVFGGRDVSPEETERVWTEALASVAIARAAVGRSRRFASRFRVSAARAWAARVARSAASAKSKEKP
ncbi:transglutaminase superfamily protein [Glaciihabitans tibetensis]|uniref:Transglutaminase superfamily protein n=1 Tax=Glaciihabitans tibetensis TaxID=1266600 RepID=A0A2T0VG66_9MICO|nr:transglutaminase domain-containing protein [Glaciihabitans tibetensis]PRY69198.1 transglutaminase superfamily protein [Glaciihabitans tibetensis]